jgi:hypothetical protein
MIIFLSILDILLVFVCFEFFSKVSFSNRPWSIPATQVLYTFIASIILYGWLKPGKDESLVKEEGY